MLGAYVWDLPPLPQQRASFGNAVAYSNQHGLVSIGGTIPDIFLGAGSYSGSFQLKWDIHNKDEDEKGNDNHNLKWDQLKRMNTGRCYSSSCFVQLESGTEVLFVCGGDLNGSCELYDFNTGKWAEDIANNNVSRECAGIYYDKFENMIYLGGGHGAEKIECYDVYKNEWNIFPNAQENHRFLSIII